ncbi:MAG: chitobiase/beta-hexosaminidase C-terminal domain-containing protein [Spirochaetales bacterium]|nr:chitobiase/beta-hexosaminidase C-terminal domain-containing protein [Spirochaetales bacterium]
MKNKILILPLILIALIFSCENPSTQTVKLSANNLFGSLTIGDTSDSRALQIEEILGAKVSVLGNDFTELSAETSITGGKTISSVTINRIPIGKNRIVSVQAAKSESAITDKDFISNVLMRAVTDIKAGTNRVKVNWASTALGNVFYELYKLEYNISDITDAQKTQLKNAIDPAIHATLINSKQIAEDFASGNLKNDTAEYTLPGATVKFEVNGNSFDDYTVMVTDPASREGNVGDRKIKSVAAGTWYFIIKSNEDDYEWYREEITVTEDNVKNGDDDPITVGINLKTPNPKILPEDMFFRDSLTISIESTKGSTVYYTTNGDEPTTSSQKYADPFPIEVDTTVKAFAEISGLNPSDIVTKEYKLSKLGFNYPTTGEYSPVDQASWGTANYSLGAHVSGNETTFALYSANATKVLLEIYDKAYGEDATYDYWLEKNKSTNTWNAKLSGNLNGKIYAYRVWGPNWEYSDSWGRGNSKAGFKSDYDENGNRFNPNKVVFDPYAREMTHDKSNPTALGLENAGMFGTGDETYKMNNGTSVIRRELDTGKWAPKGYIITDGTDFGTKPNIAQKDAIIYEAHVRGITQHSSSANLKSLLSGYAGFEGVNDIPAEYRGTYKGAALLVPYLKALGVNTIELLPVHETDNDANPDNSPGGNFWGYMTFDYFAPDRRYSYDTSAGGPTKEFKEMVKAFHDAGMEVYLDVVYNHSGEGGTWYGKEDNFKTAEIFSMRGIDNSTYYSLVDGSKGSYWETTGCGNNLQCDNDYVRRFILDSLEYWIDKMGVDGFRFDLATVLGRVKSGNDWNYQKNAKTLTEIATLGKSKNVEMIAESWDTGSGSYQVGNFPDGWAGWNGYYRDTVREYIGNAQFQKDISYTDALWGTSAHFSANDPSVNFIVAHDGFTLADLCSYGGTGNYYNDQREWPFGKSDGGNSDNNNISTDKPGDYEASRRQRARNYMTFLMFSGGIPMIVYGDELGRTQNGNNNPYNLDSVATWNNYLMASSASPQAVSTGNGTSAESGKYENMFGKYANSENKNGQLVFSSFVMNERQKNNTLKQLIMSESTHLWYSTAGTAGFDSNDGVAKAVMISDTERYYVMMNMNGGDTQFTVPAAPNGREWVRIIDTGSWAEDHFNCWNEDDSDAYSFSASTQYGVGPYTIVVFKAVINKGTVATPIISGETPFEGSSHVTITCDTPDASIYYTTDGTNPTAGSTKYTGSFTVTERTTVKAIAVLSGYKNSTVASKTFYVKGSTSESDKSGVMLQGFNWNSAPRGNGYNETNRSPYWDKWYKTVTNNASAISGNFMYLWCPPPSKTDTASSEGYAPTQLNDLNNCYGTEAELKSMITAIKPTKAIADIVINHRAGTTSWGDFTNPSWCEDYYAICSDDEGFTNSESPMYNSPKRGKPDTGDYYDAYRDLDHTNTAVQEGIIAWMNDVLRSAGFVGWRYDYVKGYAGKYVGQYNAATNAEFSVGEYWPTAGYSSSNPNAWGNEIKNWITETEQGGYRSKAFDFALKGAMNAVFNNGAGYDLLANSANLYISQPTDAVTFIDNHDTGSTQGHWPLNDSKLGAAYALILTHPGVPCVAWQHYFTYAESGSNGTDGGAQYKAAITVPGTSNILKAHIDKLIEIRKENGIEYDSVRTTLSSSSSVYAAKIEGINGTLVAVIGGSYTPSGDYGRIYKGTNFTIWKEGAEDEYGQVATKTLTITADSWTWGDGVDVFALVLGGSAGGGVWIKATGSGTTVKVDVPEDATEFLLVRCPGGTTEPNWGIMNGNGNGRIYSQTDNITISGTTYNTYFYDYPKT